MTAAILRDDDEDRSSLLVTVVVVGNNANMIVWLWLVVRFALIEFEFIHFYDSWEKEWKKKRMIVEYSKNNTVCMDWYLMDDGIFCYLQDELPIDSDFNFVKQILLVPLNKCCQ